jgi:hypothetical protein
MSKGKDRVLSWTDINYAALALGVVKDFRKGSTFPLQKRVLASPYVERIGHGRYLIKGSAVAYTGSRRGPTKSG